MVRRWAVALLATTMLSAPLCALGSAAAAAPATIAPGKHTTANIKKHKIKTAKVERAKKAHAVRSGKKHVIAKSKHQGTRRPAPVETTGSIAPGSVPTPGLY
jgi:hypothetical protein